MAGGSLMVALACSGRGCVLSTINIKLFVGCVYYSLIVRQHLGS